MALAEAAYAMRIDGENPSLKMARGAAQLAQGDLQALAVEDGSGREKVVDGHIGGEEREAVGQLKDVLVQAAAQAQAGDAECRLVDELQSQPRLHAFGRLSRSNRIPGPRPPAEAIRGPAATRRPGFP